MTRNEYGHDFSDPVSYLNAIETAVLAARHVHCAFCQVDTRMLPMTGNGWALDVIHERHCPENEDNQPAADMRFPGSDLGTGSEDW